MFLTPRFITYQGRVPDATVNVAKGFQTEERSCMLVRDMLESVRRWDESETYLGVVEHEGG